ncbi:hypothetical protein BDV18DRAFT_147611 [Aspergillus unguis]
MSYNAKNLAYDAKEPAFLQRLRGQYGNTSGGLDRPISQRPRKTKVDNEDDGPTYVDAESNEVISKEDYEAMVKGGDEQSEQPENGAKDKDAAADENGDSKQKEGASSKQNLAEIGGPRKRKQAKVVGDDVQETEGEDAKPKEPAARKPDQKKKKKKIKLSFEE